MIIAEFSRDGKHIVTASLDGTACVWDTAIGARWQSHRTMEFVASLARMANKS